MEGESPSVPLSGAELDAYKNVVVGICWWCGGTAESREHKFKRTDLDRMNDGSGLLHGSTASPNLVPVKSTRKSKVVKFGQNLCRNCNDTKSQPFDFAYDKYAQYIWDNHARLLRSPFIDMRRIYGDDWTEKSLSLARYFAKHLGCRMANDGYQPPVAIAEFLDGGERLEYVQMVLFRDVSGLRWWRRAPRAGEREPGLSMGDAHGSVNRSSGALSMFGSVTTIGRIGVLYRWNSEVKDADPFYLYRRATLHKRASLAPY